MEESGTQAFTIYKQSTLQASSTEPKPRCRRGRVLELLATLLTLLVASSMQYNTTCPIGCYKCVVDTPQGFESLRTKMPKSVKKLMMSDSGASKNVLLNPPVTCEGCWAEHLGTVGCPPA